MPLVTPPCGIGAAPEGLRDPPSKLAPGRPPTLCSGPLAPRCALLGAAPGAAQPPQRQALWPPLCKQLAKIPVMSSESTRRKRFDGLATAYGADLYRFAMWLCGNEALAKDLVQETFLRAWKALDKLRDTDAAKGWLLTILRREYARTFERKVPKFTDLDKAVVVEDSELEPDDRAEIELMRRNILELAPRYREPLLMQVVLGYSCEEISAELGVSKSAVMTQLFRAREQLKSKLQEDGVTGNIHGLF